MCSVGTVISHVVEQGRALVLVGFALMLIGQSLNFLSLVGSEDTCFLSVQVFGYWTFLLGYLIAAFSPFIFSHSMEKRRVWEEKKSTTISVYRVFLTLELSILALTGIVLLGSTVAKAGHAWPKSIVDDVLTCFVALIFAIVCVIFALMMYMYHENDNVIHEVQRWCPDVQLQGVETERVGTDKDLPVDIQVELGTGAVERGAESNGSRACGRRGRMRMRIPSLGPRLLHQLRGCSCCCLLPILVFLTMVSAWSSMLQTQYVTPTGELVSTAGNPALHLDCMPEGTYNHSKPTVLFLHGLAGTGDNIAWVRRDPDFLATRLRLCALERPGYGYSENYGKGSDFGSVAKITEAVLNKAGIKGDIIFVFHSLGSWWALSLAHQIKIISKATHINFIGAVAVDGSDLVEWKKRMEKSWGITIVHADDNQESEDQQHRMKSPAYNDPNFCNTNASFNNNLNVLFWNLIQLSYPTGLHRIVYLSGFGWFRTAVELGPPDIYPIFEANSMRQKQIESIRIESRRFDINCGWVKKGVPVFEQMKAFEVIVAPASNGGVDLPLLAKISKHSNVTIANEMTANQHGHVNVMLDKDACKRFVTPALLRVIRKTGFSE